MATEAQRRERVANGSHRQRDLAAVGPESTDVWLAKHLPGEDRYAVGAVLHRRRRGGFPVTAEAVRDELKARGWLKEQRS
jgi:hypothetical protein